LCFSGVFIRGTQRHTEKPPTTFFCFAVCLYLQGAKRLVKPLNVPHGERYCTPCKKARRKAFYLALWLVLRCVPDRLPLARLGGFGGLLCGSVMRWRLCCVPGLLRLYGSEAVQLATAARLAPLARSQGLHVCSSQACAMFFGSYEIGGGYICASMMQFESAHTTQRQIKKAGTQPAQDNKKGG